jgi:hypothetical protein
MCVKIETHCGTQNHRAACQIDTQIRRQTMKETKKVVQNIFRLFKNRFYCRYAVLHEDNLKNQDE